MAEISPPHGPPGRAHPLLGPGYSAAGPGVWLLALALIGLAGLVGLAFSFAGPALVVGVLGVIVLGVAFVVLSMQFPLASMILIVLAQVLLPVYVRIPLPGLPSPPPALLLLAMMIALSVLARMLSPKPYHPGRHEKSIATAVLIYAAVMALSIPGEHAYSGSYMMLIKTVIIPVALFFAVLGKVRSSRQLMLLYQAILFSAVACGILAMHEYYYGYNAMAKLFALKVNPDDDIFLWYLVEGRANEALPRDFLYRVFSFFTQPLEYAAFMVMVFPFAALSLAMARTLREVVIYGLASLIVLAGFIATFSRGPTLALVIVVLVLGIYEKRVRPWIMAGMLFVAGGLIHYWPMIADKLTKRLTGTENVTLRFKLWENGLLTFLEHPIRGIGYGSYPNYHAASLREHMMGPMYEFPWQRIEKVTTMENIYITLAAETGVIGLAAFALLLGMFLRSFNAVLRNARDDFTRKLALSSMAGVLGFLLSGMTVANILGYTISIMFFGVFIAGMAILSRGLPEPPPKA